MRINPLCFLLASSLLSCVRSPSPASVPVGNDTSIHFSRLVEAPAITVSPGEAVELDGVLLRALMIAANDYLPPGGKDRPCEYRQEAQRYRLLRQGDIILVYIYEDNAYCGYPYPAMDSEAKYAISTDGRILRRVIGSEPSDSAELLGFDAGVWGPPSRPGIDPEFDARWNHPDAGLGNTERDGGLSPARSTQPPAMVPDAGSP